MYRSLVPLLVLSCSALLGADATIDLIRDDFSRFPSGKLSGPVELVTPAIQEYHYLPHRGVPLDPWANAICYLDCWAVADENGMPYLEQYLGPTNRRMVPRLFSPVFITGDPLWSDYTVEVSVKPLSPDDMAGVVFRYKTNRHHYLFCLQGGNQVRLALRLPLEPSLRVAGWKELGTAPLKYDSNRYYRLKVENEGVSIRAYVDGKLLLTAEDDGLLNGKAGVSANIPARFQDFHVYTSHATKSRIDRGIRKREDELARLREGNPVPKLWKKFKTPRFGAGRSVRFGDLDGDGAPDMLFCQNIRKEEQGNFIQISCLTAVTLEGQVLWQIGDPDPRYALATYDCAFQVHDVDGDGANEVVLTKDFTIQILDGRTGKQLKSAPLPKVTGQDKTFYTRMNHPHERYRGDSISFFNFTGGKSRRDILIKDRYRVFWVWDNELNLLWSGRGETGHYPFPFRNESTGYDDLLIGYSKWDHQGKQLWSRDTQLKDHADGVAYGNFSDDPGAPPMAYYSGSDEGFILIDQHGIIRKHHRIGHAQNACVAKLRNDAPGLQYACVNYWKNPGIVTLFDYAGDILLQDEPIHSGSPLLPVNWRGDGREFLLLSGNVREGGMIDGHLRRVVMFPDDGHPDMCAAVLDLTGDPRDEIVLWDQHQVWIYSQDRPFQRKRIYAPHRNPSYNDSNYRTVVSLPHWKDLAE